MFSQKVFQNTLNDGPVSQFSYAQFTIQNFPFHATNPW